MVGELNDATDEEKVKDLFLKEKAEGMWGDES